MTDILADIDTTVDGRCACGCGAALDPNGPSGWWATEACQMRWQSHQTPPDNRFAWLRIVARTINPYDVLRVTPITGA